MLRIMVKAVMWLVLGVVLWFVAEESYTQQTRYRGTSREIW